MGQGDIAQLVSGAAQTETSPTEPDSTQHTTKEDRRPGKPRSIRVQPGDERLEIAWEPSIAPEGDPVIKYAIFLGEGEQRTVIAANEPLLHTFENLQNGIEYTVCLYAATFSGEKSEVVMVPVTPGALLDADDILVAEPTPMPDGTFALVIGNREAVDIRKGPGLTYPVTDTVEVGSELIIQDWHGEWAHTLYNGATKAGWIHTKNVLLQ